MGEVLHLPLGRAYRARREPEPRAATCGCGGQTFILVCDAQDQPDCVVCTECQHRMSLIRWSWTDDHPPRAA